MEFEDETDADLLVYMTTDDPRASEAWSVFYQRHAPEVYRRLRHRFGDQLGDHGVMDLHSETFQRAFKKAVKFEPKSTDPGIQARQVIAWLCRIANRLFLNMLREQAKLPTKPLPDDLPEPKAGEAAPDRWVLVAREVIDNVLNDLERTVLLETANWMDTATGKSNMPRGVAKAFADRLGTTVANIRQIRRRTLVKFEMLVSTRIEQRSAP